MIVQFDKKLTATLDSIRGIRSRAATLRTAITLYYVIVKAVLSGEKVFLITADGNETEVLI